MSSGSRSQVIQLYKNVRMNVNTLHVVHGRRGFRGELSIQRALRHSVTTSLPLISSVRTRCQRLLVLGLCLKGQVLGLGLAPKEGLGLAIKSLAL